MNFYYVLLLCPGIVLAFFVLYDALLAALSLVVRASRARQEESVPPGKTRFLVLVPAHNEQLLIGDLVRSIGRSSYPMQLVRTIVVADNCTDQTADISRRLGAQVLERRDDVLQGKPHALNWALRAVNLDSVDAVVILDADTVVDQFMLREFARELENGESVLQGYFGVLNPDDNWLTRLSIIPGVLKYELHNPGKNALGLSAVLAGNGMCFKSDLLKRHGWTAFSLAENWEYTAILCLQGYRVSSVASARIYSQVASTLRAGAPQRIRWHKGRMYVLAKYWRPLVRRASEGRIRRLDLLVEIAKPSHAMLLTSILLYCLAASALQYLAGSRSTEVALTIGMLALAGQVTYLLCGMLLARARLTTWLSLGMAPFYLCWKLAVTMNGLFRSSAMAWVRTRRNHE